MVDDERFSLQELAEEAGVSTRTVRYYITEGLLEPPVLAGHRSYYTRGQRDRLVAIGLLKDAFFPLREIRKRLSGVDDDQLVALIEELRGSQPERSRSLREAPAESASAYLDRVMEKPLLARMPAPAPLPSAPDPVEQRWRRIAIGDEAELTITDDLFTRKRERVEALIEWARRVLGSDER